MASIAGANGIITGYYDTRTGALRVIDAQAGKICCAGKELQVTWNQTGPQGPQGLQGPKGDQGPQGPAGVLNFYRRTERITVVPGLRTSIIVPCDPGDTVTGGSYWYIGSDLDVPVNAPHIGKESGLQGWEVTASNQNVHSSPMDVFAVCADMP